MRAAAPDAYSPIPAPAEHADGLHYQATNEGIQKLEIHLSGKESHRIAVWFKPLAEGEGLDAEAPEIKPLAEW